MSRRLLGRNADGSRVADLVGILGDSGIANLDTFSTINSTRVDASVVVRGYDADATTLSLFVGGTTLGIAGGGTDPLLAQPALGNGAADVSLTGQASNYYIDSGTTVGNIGTDDAKVKIIGKVTGTTSVIAAKRNAGVGWEIGIDASDRLYCTIDDGVGSATIVSAALEIGTSIDADLYLDRTVSGQWYVDNATSGAAVDISGVQLTLDSATSLAILADSGGNSPTDFGLVYFSITHSAAWFSTHLNATDHATEFYKWSGLYGKVTTGTPEPTFYTRASSAYVPKWNGSSFDLINCASGVPRVGWNRDSSGADFKGLLDEPAATNLFPESNDLDDAAWTKLNLNSIDSATGIQTPDSDIDYQGIIANTSSAAHGVIEAATVTAANYCASYFVQAGSLDWVQINNTTAAANCYFDVTNGVVGTASGTVDQGMTDLGGGNYLVWMCFLGTAAAHTIRFQSAEDDGDSVFQGDDSTTQTYMAFAQLELGNKPSSRIVTTGATVTRAADSLQYNGDNVTAGQGAFVCEVLIDDHAPSDNLYAFAISDGTGTNRIIQFSNVTPITRFVGTDGGVGQWSMGAADIADGVAHKIRCIWESNNAKQYIDGVIDGTPDTSCTIPTGLTDIDIGQLYNDTDQLNGWIRNLQVWPWAEENLG